MTEVQMQGYLQAFADKYKERFDSLGKDLALNQAAVDELLAKGGARSSGFHKKTLSDRIVEELGSRKDEVENFMHSKSAKIEMTIKTAGILLASDHLTGDPQASYNPQGAIAPGHSSNFRDLIPTLPSPTGTYITYVEGAVTNSVAAQTEGQAKAAQDYTWSEVKTISNYVAAITRFSKQLMYNLPFLQNTLTQELLRDFFMKENELFYAAAVLAATGNDAVSGATVDAEEVLQIILNQRKANYVPSYAIVDWAQLGLLLTTKPADYSMPGSFTTDAQGNIRIMGTPVIGASWADSDSVLVIDRSQIARAETESLNVTFSYEDQDNWSKNLVSARVECFEQLAIHRPESIIFHDLGNS